MNPVGFAAGLATAAFWTATSICFEESSRRIGSLVVNFLRLAFALALYTALALVRTGSLVPPVADASAWGFLSLSGLVGFVIGDLLLFRAFVLVGSRLSMLVYASSPMITAVIGYLFLGERMSPPALAGMALVVAGIGAAILGRRGAGDVAGTRASGDKKITGILMAFGGAVGQAGGLILGKRGAVGLDSFSASHIRVIAGLAGFGLIIVLSGGLGNLARPFKLGFGRGAPDPEAGPPRKPAYYRGALGFMAAGATMGPFLGVSLGLLSAQLTSTGAASTLMSIVPVLIIPVAAIFFKEKVRAAEILGAVATVAGIALLAL